MAIKSKIPDQLEKRDMNASDLMRLSGVAYSTAHYLAKGRIGKSISIELLDQLCKIFNCTVCELLEYQAEPLPVAGRE